MSCRSRSRGYARSFFGSDRRANISRPRRSSSLTRTRALRLISDRGIQPVLVSEGLEFPVVPGELGVLVVVAAVLLREFRIHSIPPSSTSAESKSKRKDSHSTCGTKVAVSGDPKKDAKVFIHTPSSLILICLFLTCNADLYGFPNKPLPTRDTASQPQNRDIAVLVGKTAAF